VIKLSDICWPPRLLEDVFRSVNTAARVRDGEGPGLTRGGSLNFPHHLTKIKFGNDEGFYFRSEFANLFFGERPGGDQAQFADAQTTFTSGFDSSLRHSRSDPVRDDDYVGALELLFFKQGDAVGGGANLVFAGGEPLCPAPAESCWDSRVRRGSGR